MDPTSRSLIEKIVTNLRDFPSNKKFQKLKKANPKVAVALAAPGALDVLAAAGFSADPTGDWLIFAALEANVPELTDAALQLLASFPAAAAAAAPSMLAEFTFSKSIEHGGVVRGVVLSFPNPSLSSARLTRRTEQS